MFVPPAVQRGMQFGLAGTYAFVDGNQGLEVWPGRAGAEIKVGLVTPDKNPFWRKSVRGEDGSLDFNLSPGNAAVQVGADVLRFG